MEKILCKKKEDARVRKMVSRRKLGKLEIRRSKKITKEQVRLFHVIEDRDVSKISEALAYTAKLKAKGQVKLFRKNVYSLLDQYSVADVSKATKIPYYKVNRMLTWKRKNPLELMYTWKLPQSVREEVADFFWSSLISYELPDMWYCNKRFMQMSVEEAYDVYKMNLTNERRCVAISTFGKLQLTDVITIDNTPVRQCWCHTCQNFRLTLLSMIRCGFKGIYRNARKAVEASICGMTLLPDIYNNNKFTKIPNMKCCLGECKECCYKKQKMCLIAKNAKLLAWNISCSWSRWVRPNNVETNSKKNAKTKEEEQCEDDGRKNRNGKKQKEKEKFKALMIEEKTGTAIDLLNAYIEDIQVMRKHHFYNVWQTY